VRRLLRNLALYAFHLGFARPVLKWVVGLRYRRRSLIPKGPCIVVSNHNSHLDAAILMTAFPLRRLPHVHPVAAADYFGKTWLKRTMALLLMNGLPIERQPPRGTDPLAPLIDALKAGQSLVFFPEGSRGEAGVVAPFRAGIGRLVQQVPGLLIVPVFLSGPERIWARGQVVPVPLNTDAIVGRPRTYSADGDPKAIADQVRRDVLALAPPPPPSPSRRPPTIRISICGLDPEVRESLFRAVVDRMAAHDTTLGIAERVLEGGPDGVREISRPIPLARGRPWLGPLATVFRTGGMFKGEKFVEMVERAQINEALGQGRASRWVVTDGSALVDLMAWAESDFYRGVFKENEINRLMQYLAGQKRIPMTNWLTFIRRAPEVWLINVLDLARPPVPDLLVLARLPVERVLAGLRSRGEKLQPHESPAFLAKLDEAQRRVAGVLEKRRRVELLELDMAELGTEEAADLVERAALRQGRAEESAASESQNASASGSPTS
jgi:1-acyl-sn-glycerol-3-phosphate acyltransferase